MQGFVDVKKRASTARLMDQSTCEGLRKVMSTTSEANVIEGLAEELAEVKAMLKEKKIKLRESKTEIN